MCVVCVCVCVCVCVRVVCVFTCVCVCVYVCVVCVCVLVCTCVCCVYLCAPVCSRYVAYTSMPCPYASCNDCCIVHSTSAGADPELVGGGDVCSCMLLLHPTPTCTDAGPDLCTLHPDFAPCACGGCHQQQLMVVVFLSQLLAQRLHLHTWQFFPLQFAPVVFSFHPLVQIPYLHSSNLYYVVMVFWWW